MPITITIAIVAAIAKAGCFLIGSLVHEVNELTKRFGVDHEEAVIATRAPSLLIKVEQLGRLQETPKAKVPSSNALVLYASRAVVLTMSNDSLALESQFDVVENNPFSIVNNLRIFAAWYLARCIALMQSALRSFIPDMKVAISSFFGSVSESVVEKKVVSSISFLIQVNFSRLIAKVVLILKEAIHLLKSRTEKNISALPGQAFPAGIRGKETALPLCSVVGDSLPVNVGTCTLKNLTMTITCVKQALAIRFGHSTSLHRPLQLLGVKMTTLVCLLLCVSISVIGWSIPLMLFDGSKLEQDFLQHQNIPEAVLDLEAGAFRFSSITSRLTSLPGDTSNSLISMESISNVVDLHSFSTAVGTSDRQADLNRHGLADSTLCMLLWQAMTSVLLLRLACRVATSLTTKQQLIHLPNGISISWPLIAFNPDLDLDLLSSLVCFIPLAELLRRILTDTKCLQLSMRLLHLSSFLKLYRISPL
eukprot:scaffold4148_cov170-Skeletonema_marinoi.AAC.1